MTVDRMLRIGCCRCPESATVEAAKVDKTLGRWSTIRGQFFDTQDIVGTTEDPDHLCVNCTDALRDFLAGLTTVGQLAQTHVADVGSAPFVLQCDDEGNWSSLTLDAFEVLNGHKREAGR